MTLATATRARPYAATTFTAFRVTESNRAHAVALHLAHRSLDEALNEALTRTLLCHKETLVIRETGEGGDKLHLYRIRQRAPQWVYRGHEKVREQALYAEKQCEIDAGVLV